MCFEVSGHLRLDMLRGTSPHHVFVPGPSGVQLVPFGSAPAVAVGTRVVKTEASDGLVPQRLEALDQQRLAEGNPDVLNDEVAAAEVRETPGGGAVRQ